MHRPQVPLDNLDDQRIDNALRVLRLIRRHHGTYDFAAHTPEAMGAVDLSFAGYCRVLHRPTGGWCAVSRNRTAR